jgi:nucleoside 2-deoxyribosyltransferase
MSDKADRPRVYLAGPGVFRPNALAFGKMLKEKCAQAGLTGCFPMDNEISGESCEKAKSIYEANLDLINTSRAIIADISPFRGPNMDPGTAWEIGYGVSKGLPVFAWTTDHTHLLDRTLHMDGLEPQSVVDRNGWSIENFSHVENLMIAISVEGIHNNEDAAISACAAALLSGGRP